MVAGVLGALSIKSEADAGLPPSELDARIANGADIVLLGNSKVGTDLDAAAIAAASGDASARVVKMNVNGTGAPVWYAVLKNRVYDKGFNPKIIFVYATLRMGLQVDLPSAEQRAMLAKELAGPDPVIDRKVFGVEHSNETWERVLTHRTELRKSLTDDLRDAVAGLFFAPPDAKLGLLERGRAVSEPALGQVLGSDALLDTKRSSAIPIVEIERPQRADESLSPEDTLVPDIVALAKAHGAEIVWLRSPLATTHREHDIVEPALEKEVIELLGKEGAGYVDLRPVGPPDASYGDGAHMSRSGRSRFMPAMLAELRKIGFGSGHPMAAAKYVPPRPRPTVTRTGPGPTLPALDLVRGRLPCDYQAMAPDLFELSDTRLKERGLGEISPFVVLEDGRPLGAHAQPGELTGPCNGRFSHFKNVFKVTPSGDDPEAAKSRTYTLGLDPSVPTIGTQYEEAWWVYPGTTLRFDFPAGAVAGARNVLLRAADPIAGAGAATLRVDGGEAVPAERVGVGLEALAHAPASGDAWSIEVPSPADGPWLLVQGLAVGEEAEPWHVIGGPREETSVDVLVADATYDAEPRKLFGPLQRPQPAPWRDGMWILQVDGYGVPPTEDVFEKAGAGCSALRLKIDDVPVETIVDPATKTPLAVAVHSKERMMVRASDEAHPLDLGAAYSLYLDPTRKCAKKARWLYPGDGMTLAIPADMLAPLRLAADTLQISGAAFYGVDGDTVTAEVRVGDVVNTTATFPLGDFDKGLVSIRLASPVARDAANLTVRLSTATKQGYLLVTGAALAEPPAPLFASL